MEIEHYSTQPTLCLCDCTTETTMLCTLLGKSSRPVMGVTLVSVTVVGLKDCQYNNAVHATGDKFPSSDGCNTCFCNNGAVACTLKFCLPKSRY